MIESSIDCSIHVNDKTKTKEPITCKLCSPDNNLLYHPILAKQMKLPNPCKKHIAETIKAKQVYIDGVENPYAYVKKDKNSYNIYEFSNEVNGYIPITSTHPLYSDIIRKILKNKYEIDEKIKMLDNIDLCVICYEK